MFAWIEFSLPHAPGPPLVIVWVSHLDSFLAASVNVERAMTTVPRKIKEATMGLRLIRDVIFSIRLVFVS
jgi:hypothetical protein